MMMPTKSAAFALLNYRWLSPFKIAELKHPLTFRAQKPGPVPLPCFPKALAILFG